MVDSFTDLLLDARIRFIVIGGQAMVKVSGRATDDVDVMVLSDDMDRLLSLLERYETKGLVKGLYLSRSGPSLYLRGRWIPTHEEFDALDVGYFTDLDTETAFVWLIREFTDDRGGVTYAQPSLVLYCRLIHGEWERYRDKARADALLVGEVSEGWKVDAMKIANRLMDEPRAAELERRLQEV